MIGFFEVIEKENISSEFQLFQTIKIYNIFHLNHLQKALTDLLTGQVNKLAPLVIINNKEEWEVEDIFDARNFQGKIQY